tara:strand:- start:155 stop:1303 length:1149 start_codon:yes stop_codon:yes gene_type:complete
MNKADIKIYIRLCPIKKSKKQFAIYDNKNIIIKYKQESHVERNKILQYRFDRIFNDKITNNCIYDFCLKRKIKEKNKFYVIAYGQTGTGKTHTLLKNDGLLWNSIKQLDFDVCISSIEIYNNKMYDIISRKEINIWESNNIHKLWKRVESKKVNNSLETKKYLQKINKSRKEQKTYKNNNSSRSHLFIQIKSKDKTIYFVDLAGKEHSKDSKDYDKKIKIESNYINQSLFGLKECIRASYLKNKYIPFRQCCLTRLLKDVFIGTQTVVISTLSSSNKDIHSSIDTLNYVNQLQNIKLPNISPLIQPKRSKIVDVPKLDLTSHFTSSDNLIKKYIKYAKKKTLSLKDNIKNILKIKNVDEKILEWINYENQQTKIFLNEILIN